MTRVAASIHVAINGNSTMFLTIDLASSDDFGFPT